jgi:hypothetical protein
VSEILDTYPCGGGSEMYFNCICVVFNELVTADNGGSGKNGEKMVYSVKKAFCFMFVNTFY